MRKKKKSKKHDPLNDWKEVYESLVGLADAEANEKEEFQFTVLAAIVNWIISIIEEGMNLPEELKIMLGMTDTEFKGSEDYFS